ncbi:MAG TPA: four helix bundle protein [Candidatus Acidoferrales bacterium]|nr:four helix bundle protein [Candidatus Acidoferrales bacterium]
MKDFTDLDAWKLARQLRQTVFAITRAFPNEERYVLTNQLWRAAMSITANIAEGFGRFSYRENIQFCRQARGSVFEVRDHLTSALDAGYLPAQTAAEIDANAQRVIQVLNGYIRATQKRDMSRQQGN